MTDYAQALEGIEWKLRDGSLTVEETASVIRALRIADKLQQEPSEAMCNAGLEGADLKVLRDYKGNPTGQKITIDNEECASIFKAMRDQLLKEVKDV